MNPSPSPVAGGPTPRHRPPFTATTHTPESAADAVAIQQLIARYAHMLDSDATSAADLAAMFAEDGRVTPAYEGDGIAHTGRPAIEAWFRRYLDASRASSKIRRHLISTTRIDVAGDKAWAFSFLDASGIQVKDSSLGFFIGSYEDDLVKRGGRWFFANRRICLDYTCRAPAHELMRNGKQQWEGQPDA